MKYQIDKNQQGVEITVEELSEQKKQQILTEFQLCREGKCDCPTDEYDKVAAVEIKSTQDHQIKLNLKAKPGQKFDEDEIGKCLDHTQKKTNKE